MNFCQIYNKLMNIMAKTFIKILEDDPFNFYGKKRENVIQINIFEGIFYLLLMAFFNIFIIICYCVHYILITIYKLTISKCPIKK